MPAPEFFQNLVLRILDFQETLSLPPGGAFKNRDAFYNSDTKARHRKRSGRDHESTFERGENGKLSIVAG